MSGTTKNRQHYKEHVFHVFVSAPKLTAKSTTNYKDGEWRNKQKEKHELLLSQPKSYFVETLSFPF